MDVERELHDGIAHQQAGDLAAAGCCYRNVLDRDPGNVDALYLMSVLSGIAGKPEIAIELASAAISRQPDYFAPYLSLGNAWQSLGETGRAEQAFRKAVELNPQSGEAFSNLSHALKAQERFEEAAVAAADAIVHSPDLPEAHNNFGNALLALESPEEAIEAYGRATALRPGFAEAWFNLGAALVAAERRADAVDAYLTALNLSDRPDWRFNLANNFVALRRLAEAEAAYDRVLAADADHVSARINLANLLTELDRFAEAEALLRDGLARFPDEAELHWNLALLLLQTGRMAEAWPEYEWRWGLPAFTRIKRRFPAPRWAGEPLAGRRLLLHVEQGYGDAIEFCRFVPRVDGPVVVECRPGLERLFATLAGDVAVVTAGTTLPPCDLELPLMSLPGVLGIDLDDLPGAVPYLGVPQGSDHVADHVHGPGLKVGIVWAGSPTRKANHRRSLGAADFAPLFRVPGCRFHSLQVGGSLDQVAGQFDVVDLAPALRDFADTAAAIARLDLVITVDTAVAHLAGALGKPVWVLLSKPCDGYLWMVDRADSPWYPSARLFRQQREGEWGAVFDQVAEALAAFRDGRRQEG